MANGTISIADGLGLKALDSNEVRRRQQVSELSKFYQIPSRNSPMNSDSKAVQCSPFQGWSLNHSSELPIIPQTSEHSTSHHFQPIPSDLETLKLNSAGNFSGDFNLGSNVLCTVPSPSPVGLGEISPKSPKKSSPSRKLQQVFEQALIREAEERAAHLQANDSQFECHQKQLGRLRQGNNRDSWLLVPLYTR
ncbi:hypothetical protein RHGRI_034247 [Rhododendron griersonianum]|uniref:Uncharacterized protein n=1 Tax=Rhododendron griersonianum TaxID=479676 RepID=A0AAV6I0Q6_9ERIC|nr:hypothetical protein RHGRI_034247 [Rhododendron griersonianum]